MQKRHYDHVNLGTSTYMLNLSRRCRCCSVAKRQLLAARNRHARHGSRTQCRSSSRGGITLTGTYTLTLELRDVDSQEQAVVATCNERCLRLGCTHPRSPFPSSPPSRRMPDGRSPDVSLSFMKLDLGPDFRIPFLHSTTTVVAWVKLTLYLGLHSSLPNISLWSPVLFSSKPSDKGDSSRS